MKISRLAFGFRTVLMISAIGGLTTTVSAASDRAGDDRHSVYLALGDSVAFGYITQAGYAYINPGNFVGYPAYVSPAPWFFAANASCPGETTSSFLSSVGVDNGCRTYRAQAPLHVPYMSTQLDFAIGFLRAHRDTRLVTVTLGANDLFLLERDCAGDLACVTAGLPATLAAIGLNMETIVWNLRATGFRGPIVVVNYYSPDYNDEARTGIIGLLNQALTAAAAAPGAIVADVFTAFQAAASTQFAAGSPCKAGLLNAYPGDESSCDVHPSQSGQRLIAQTVKRAARIARRGTTP